MNNEVRALTKKLAQEYKIDIDLADYAVQYVTYDGAHATLAEKKKSFARMLRSLQPGKTYLYLDHPALNDAEAKAIHHIGYENVAEDRQGVTDLWTDKEIKALIQELKIQLISYADLKNNPSQSPAFLPHGGMTAISKPPALLFLNFVIDPRTHFFRRIP
ncbi:hypothetical protein [Paraflavitalea speifideaquila]|uniref:hypothetical protein n=1 Tax=Paraflavitalea speifideaquila TaxID=3076558 RepID=UPI0028EEC52D|nr:hypothetical protein [Paraflavitalea speifideiaquila]